RSPNEQLSVFELIEQPVTAGLMVQAMPDPVGSGSESVTLFAVPPGEALLVTVMVNPIESPADTEAASAVLVMASPGDFIVKHSAVVSVCSPGEYCAVPEGVNSARKQYVPSCVGVNAVLVAVPVMVVPGETATDPPTCVPP